MKELEYKLKSNLYMFIYKSKVPSIQRNVALYIYVYMYMIYKTGLYTDHLFQSYIMQLIRAPLCRRPYSDKMFVHHNKMRQCYVTAIYIFFVIK